MQNVENRLGVPIDARSGGRGHCIWIYPATLNNGENLSASNLNFAGFDYARAWEQPDHKFGMVTVVGVKNHWYNERLFPKLNDPTLIKIIEDIYRPCYFRRRVRINKAAMMIFPMVKRYDSLADYLRDVPAGKIWFSYMTPDDCINRLKTILNGLGIPKSQWDDSVHDAIAKLQRFRFKDYNWLEYLEIVTEPQIDCRGFLNGDLATLAVFEWQLVQHIVGMIILDLIFNEDPATVAKINALIAKLP